MLYLGFVSTLFCFVLWPYPYSQFTAEQLIALPNGCALWSLQHIVVSTMFAVTTLMVNLIQSLKSVQKQSKTKTTVLIRFCGHLIDCSVLLFYLTFQVYWKMSRQMLLIGLGIVLELRDLQISLKPSIKDLICVLQGSLLFCFSKDQDFHESTGRDQTLIVGLNSNHQPDICS